MPGCEPLALSDVPTSERLPPSIRTFRSSDLPAIVRIHQELFPSSRSTVLGPAFLTAMYRWFLTNYHDLTVVAEVDGRVVGFAVGSVGGYGRRLLRVAWPQVAWGLIRRPALLVRGDTFRLWRSYAKAFNPRLDNAPAAGTKVSLASIAVARSAQGMGIGTLLLRQFERRAAARHAASLGLSVEGGNVAARRLYESCGWVLTYEAPDQSSAYYIKPLPASEA